MISVLLSARASYAKLQPVLEALGPGDVEIVATGAALLPRYGRVVDQVRRDFPQQAITELYSTYEGATLETAAKETASLLSSLTEHYARTRPRLVVVTADRHETVAASLAASYLNIPVAHLQGGERSGNIDDHVRDVNSVLAVLHFPATARAALRLSQFVRRDARIYHYGCSSIDVACAAQFDPAVETTDELGGVGPRIDFRSPFLMLLLHPETERPDEAADQMRAVVQACQRIPLPRLVLWPGQDAGAELGAKALREVLASAPSETFHAVRTIPPRRFLRLLGQATVLVGNSSAGIREASALGTPVVNVGQRQAGRERGLNVVDVEFEPIAIYNEIARQRTHGPYPASLLYGNGHAAPRIAAALRGAC